MGRKTDKERRTVSVVMDDDLYEAVEKQRGMVPRSTFISGVLRKALGLKKMMMAR